MDNAGAEPALQPEFLAEHEFMHGADSQMVYVMPYENFAILHNEALLHKIQRSLSSSASIEREVVYVCETQHSAEALDAHRVLREFEAFMRGEAGELQFTKQSFILKNEYASVLGKLISARYFLHLYNDGNFALVNVPRGAW